MLPAPTGTEAGTTAFVLFEVTITAVPPDVIATGNSTSPEESLPPTTEGGETSKFEIADSTVKVCDLVTPLKAAVKVTVVFIDTAAGLTDKYFMLYPGKTVPDPGKEMAELLLPKRIADPDGPAGPERLSFISKLPLPPTSDAGVAENEAKLAGWTVMFDV